MEYLTFLESSRSDHRLFHQLYGERSDDKNLLDAFLNNKESISSDPIACLIDPSHASDVHGMIKHLLQSQLPNVN